MDHFGIGAAVRGAFEMYFRSARQTGRTTSLVESLKDGDRVIFVDSRQADIVRRMCAERHLKVECIVLEPKRRRELCDRAPSEGRTLFDHVWVEQYYRESLDDMVEEVDRLQRETSGFGAAHLETRRAAAESSRWRW